MKLITPFLLLAIFTPSCDKVDNTPPAITATPGYTIIATDPSGDNFYPEELDGTRLEYKYNATSDSLWFLFKFNTINTAQSQNVALNVMVRIKDGMDSTFYFWGEDNYTNEYHRLLTVWVTGTAPSNYTGTIGIANSTDVNHLYNYNNLYSNNISIKVDTVAKTALLGLKRTDLINDLEFPDSTFTVKVAGAIGTRGAYPDDIYSPTATMRLR